jgi:hypothetical protein
MVWGPDTAGAVSTLEVQIPAGAAASQVQLAVPRLSHLTQTAAQESAKAIGDASGSSYVDVRCVTPLPPESRAVVHLQYVGDDNFSYQCSGTLMNDSSNSRRPFILTAQHCMPDQAAASSLITRYFYRAASCNSSPITDTAMKRVDILGARYLQADGTTDSSLVELNDTQVPANVVYAGSYFGYQDDPNTPELDPSPPIIGGNTPVIGIHHPLGDLQKFSQGYVTDFSICDGNDICYSSPYGFDSGSLYAIQWTQGAITGGSSGSPLFAAPRLVQPTLSQMRYVVGMLSRGNTGANGASPSMVGIYGRFDLSFYRGLNKWLMPTPAQ